MTNYSSCRLVLTNTIYTNTVLIVSLYQVYSANPEEEKEKEEAAMTSVAKLQRMSEKLRMMGVLSSSSYTSSSTSTSEMDTLSINPSAGGSGGDGVRNDDSIQEQDFSGISNPTRKIVTSSSSLPFQQQSLVFSNVINTSTSTGSSSSRKSSPPPPPSSSSSSCTLMFPSSCSWRPDCYPCHSSTCYYSSSSQRFYNNCPNHKIITSLSSLPTMMIQVYRKIPLHILVAMIIIAFGSLLFGIVIGWYLGQRQQQTRSSSRFSVSNTRSRICSSSTRSSSNNTNRRSFLVRLGIRFQKNIQQPLLHLVVSYISLRISHVVSLLYVHFWIPQKQQPSFAAPSPSLPSSSYSSSIPHKPPSSSPLIATVLDTPTSSSSTTTTTTNTSTSSLLLSTPHTTSSTVPYHIGVIMDGNRRYGIKTYQHAYQGHVDGAKKLIQFIQWCIDTQISILTVYAFSTENWNRDPKEIQTLFSIVHSYCEEIQNTPSLKDQIHVHRITTLEDKIPTFIVQRLDQLVQETTWVVENPKLTLNICFSYGSRGEIVLACQNILKDVLFMKHSHGQESSITSKCPTKDHENHILTTTKKTITSPEDCIITEELFTQYLQTKQYPDPDLILRTSGEMRLSNFLLWQSAYSELFFVDKTWPEMEKNDFDTMIQHYSNNRHRRYGK